MRISRHAGTRYLSMHLLIIAAGAPVAVSSLALAAPYGEVLPAAAADAAAGRWEGAIELPGAQLKVEVTLTPAGDGLTGAISIPQQGAKDLALENITRDGSRVTFVIPGIPGEPTFSGTLSADNASIAGDFSQSGKAFPFKLTRAADPGAQAADALAGIDQWLDDARQAWKAPGLAIAIVKGDNTVFARGFGMRDVDGDKPVTADTLFAIGSSSKAFTTAVLGALADEGKLDWDAPVRTYLPDFALFDEEIAQRMTPTDLVTHRSGLPRHDLMWYNAPFTREEIYHRLKYLANNKDLRTDFQYNNLMYLTAGVLAERITGKSWEDNVRERFFVPLGMTHSCFSAAQAPAGECALPYREDEKVVKQIPYREIQSVGPAGSIYSSAADMARWVALHLTGKGQGGARVLTDQTIQQLHTVEMPYGILNPDTPEIVPVGYALGWFVDVYRGHLRVHHGGNIDGFSALVTLFPQDGVGIVALTNMEASALPGQATRHASDRMLGLSLEDWNAKALAKRDQSTEMSDKAKEKKTAFRRQGTTPSHAIGEYAGQYEHPGYGTIDVTESQGALSLAMHGISAPLEHWHYDVFNCLKNPADPTFEDTKVMFLSGLGGDIDSLRVSLDPLVDDIIFQRTPDAELKDARFLSRLAGKYALGPQTVTFEVKGAVLWANVPGQPNFELIPASRRTFNLKGLNGYSVRFDVPDAGPVKQAYFMQPDGNYTATRAAE